MIDLFIIKFQIEPTKLSKTCSARIAVMMELDQQTEFTEIIDETICALEHESKKRPNLATFLPEWNPCLQELHYNISEWYK